MNTRQHILLELGVENPVPVSDALYHVESNWPTTYTVLFNRNPLGVTQIECAGLLWDLYQQDMIAFYPYRRDPFRATSSALHLTRKELLAALRTGHDARRTAKTELLYYKLTPAGGSTWEVLASARWDRFLSHEEASGETWDAVFGVGETIPKLTERQQQNRLQVRLRSCSPEVAEDRYRLDAVTFGIVVSHSRVDRTFTEWAVTYWKTVPFGYEIGYSLYSPEEMQTGPMVRSGSNFVDDPRRNTPTWYNEAPDSR